MDSAAAENTSMAATSGKRMQLLYAAHEKSLEKLLKAGSFEKAATEFPEYLGDNRKDGVGLSQETMKQCYSQVLDTIVASTKEEFDAIVAELNMETYLEKLDNMCVAARAVIKTPKEDLPRRHTSPRDVAVAARLHRIKQMEIDNARLQITLDELLADNEKTERTLEQHRNSCVVTTVETGTPLEQVVLQCEARDTIDVLAKAKRSLTHQ
eukprot:m.84870 g.84870  ORF g.84870 m.84870 type:complete len:210 (-) comp16358_c0_seq1:142-771(-)